MTTQTHNTIPQQGAGFYADLATFLRNEDAQRFADMFQSFVVSGGTHATGVGLTQTPDPLMAYAGGYYVTETGAITYPDNATCWIAAHKDTTTAVVGFSRVSGTHYIINTASPTQPATPADSVWLMAVVTSGGSVTAVRDLRIFSPVNVGYIDADAFSSLQDAIDAAQATGVTEIRLSAKRYQSASMLTLNNISGTFYNGLRFVGSGWSPGATPVNNVGTWIEYTEATGSLFQLRGVGNGTGFIGDISFERLGLQATHASYVGELIELRTASRIKFQDVGLYGRQDQTPQTGSALLSGNQWIALSFKNVVFSSADYGIRQVAIGGFTDFANVVQFEECEFTRLNTPTDIQLSPQSVTFVKVTGEPSASGAEAPFIVSGGKPVTVRESWFGDGDSTGTWIQMIGAPLCISNNYFGSGLVAVDVVNGNRTGLIDGNGFYDVKTGIQYNAAADPGPSAKHNFFVLVTNGIGIDVVAGNGIILESNAMDKGGSATGTTGYRFGAGTQGTLIQHASGTADTNVVDNSTGGWNQLTTP